MPRDTAIQVLKAHGVQVTASPIEGGAVVRVTAMKPGEPESAIVLDLGDPLIPKTLYALAGLYGIPTDHFYHPERAKP